MLGLATSNSSQLHTCAVSHCCWSSLLRQLSFSPHGSCFIWSEPVPGCPSVPVSWVPSWTHAQTQGKQYPLSKQRQIKSPSLSSSAPAQLQANPLLLLQGPAWNFPLLSTWSLFQCVRCMWHNPTQKRTFSWLKNTVSFLLLTFHTES